MDIRFYTFYLWLCKAGSWLVMPWNRKARLWIKGRKNSIETIKSVFQQKQQQSIWMHCASLGEFEQGLPILEQLKRQYPSYPILLTFFSPAGYELRKNFPGADHVAYLPYDSAINATALVDVTRPALVLWVKPGYCLFYLEELKKRRIPSLLISGAFVKEQSAFRWCGKIQRSMLGRFSHIFVQALASKKMLGTIGLSENVSVGGDTRFDRVIEIAENFLPDERVSKFCGSSPVIVAGSTWEEDEEELDHYANTHPEIKFIIAPHEVDDERLREVKRLFKHAVFFSGLSNENENTPGANTVADEQANVLIIDNIGMLARLYHYATIAYVGGGFIEDGVHNVLEAAVYGKPVVYGPVIENYIEAIDLVDCGGGIVVDSALEVEETFNRLLSNPGEYAASCAAAKNYVHSKNGATQKIIGYIQEKRLLTN